LYFLNKSIPKFENQKISNEFCLKKKQDKIQLKLKQKSADSPVTAQYSKILNKSCALSL
jgi:hypothetical protein